jgi:DNA-binding NarL/FixJ family response regulator
MPLRRGPTPPLPPDPPDALRVTRLALGEGNVVIFSHPVEPTPGAELARLSPSERDVLRLLLAGHTNAEIATQRGTTPRTVVKQVDAVYRKLGVRSRAELAARYG